MTARWMPECERGRNIDMWWPPRQCQKKFGAIFVLVAAGFAPALFPPPNMCASTRVSHYPTPILMHVCAWAVKAVRWRLGRTYMVSHRRISAAASELIRMQDMIEHMSMATRQKDKCSILIEYADLEPLLRLYVRACCRAYLVTQQSVS